MLIEDSEFGGVKQIGKYFTYKGKHIAIADEYLMNSTTPVFDSLFNSLDLVGQERLKRFLVTNCNNKKSVFEKNTRLEKKEIYRNYFLMQKTDYEILIYRRKAMSNQVEYLGSTKDDMKLFKSIKHDMEYVIEDPEFYNLSLKDSKNKINDMIRSRTFSELTEEIKLIGNKPDDICFFYIPIYEFMQIADSPTPAWDNFLFQFETNEEKNLFKAYVFSLFLNYDFGRALLWLHGAGQSGKSSVCRVLYKIFATFGNSLAQVIDEVDSKFIFDNIDSSRLVMISDTKKTNLLQNRSILNITGNDLVKVEKKFEQGVTKQLFSKMIICSNFAPKISVFEKHEVSRLLYLKLNDQLCAMAFDNWKFKFNDKPWEQSLYDEFWSFYKTCEKPYKDLVNNSYDFKLSQAFKAKMINNCSDLESKKMSTFFTYKMVKGQDGDKLSSEFVCKEYSKFTKSIEIVTEDLRNKVTYYLKHFLDVPQGTYPGNPKKIENKYYYNGLIYKDRSNKKYKDYINDGDEELLKVQQEHV